MPERLRVRHLESPKARDRAVSARTASGKPKKDDLLHSFGRVETGAGRREPEKIVYHDLLKDMPHHQVLRYHRIFHLAPKTIDFSEFRGNPEEQRRALIAKFEPLKNRGLEFLRTSITEGEKILGGDFVNVKARVRLQSGSDPVLVKLLYERGGNGAYELREIDFDIFSGQSRLVYTADHYELFRHAMKNALRDIERAE